MQEPRPYHYTPPSDESTAQLRAYLAEQKAQDDERERFTEPFQRPILEAGPALRNIEAALSCSCTCHPRLSGAHEGGTTCFCQLTPEERAAAAQELSATFEADPKVAEESSKRSAALHSALQQEASRLRVEATLKNEYFPLVITGTADGRFFYLKEKRGNFTVSVASDAEPLLDVYEAGYQAPYIELESGDSDSFMDDEINVIKALRIAVGSVRTYLNQAACTHIYATGSNYCPDCGKPQIPPEEQTLSAGPPQP